MKLIRFGNIGNEKPGIFVDGKRKDVSSKIGDWNHNFFQNFNLEGLEELLGPLENFPDVSDDVRWASCVARPGKIICIGLNYSDHAAESGMDIPKEPIIFQKASNTMVGPNDNIIIPKKSLKTDWEVELGIIIGKDARYLNSKQEAKDFIAGYCVSHDVSERAFQLEMGGQWTKGKSCDSFNPLGPYMVTANDIVDVNNLNMSLYVNGEQMQKGNTSFMVFDPYTIVEYLSQFMTLEAGDLINTGTPPGVGLGMKPPKYLKDGDILELSIEGLGTQKQICKDA
ncbi:fumarylacetoacetate hydrolase family protein [Mariniflexile sp.]|uniref:fumarylacetoacetate hydrolase family protein n=1 Tax=Mariniflexile sp. TaxID=1979402 RepID=UPI0040473242